MREKYWALEAAMAAEEARDSQLELELFEDLKIAERDRLDRLGALRRFGRDETPDAPIDHQMLEAIAEVFPGGMTFTEIAWVLGVKRKQHVYKICQRAAAKVMRAMRFDAAEIREALRERDASCSSWEAQVMG